MEAVTPSSFMNNLKQVLNEQHDLLRDQKQQILKNEEWEQAVLYRDIEKKLKQAIALFDAQVAPVNRNGL